MADSESWLVQELNAHGISRREFLGFCTATAALLALPKTFAAKIAAAVEAAEKPTLVWLEFQDCAGNTESFLRAGHPTVAQIILDTLSVDYHETIMAAAGHQAEENLAKAITGKRGQYITVVEGSIPTGEDGAYCTIGGKAALQIAREVCGGSAATIAIGTCACFGGIPAAAPNPTGALGVADAVPGVKNLINLSACPANVANLTALIVYYLTFKYWPPLDQYRRPLFAYGQAIHDACERRAHYDAGQYVEAWGDAGHRHGYCLYKMGCKGPVTFQNCPNVLWNQGTNWPIGCGHPCIGCAEPDFWDKMTPFYQHLQGVPGFGVASNIDRIGLWATIGVGAAFGAHGVVEFARRWMRPQPKPEGASKPAPESKKGDES
jgi:hydrogenase small subunit